MDHTGSGTFVNIHFTNTMTDPLILFISVHVESKYACNQLVKGRQVQNHTDLTYNLVKSNERSYTISQGRVHPLCNVQHLQPLPWGAGAEPSSPAACLWVLAQLWPVTPCRGPTASAGQSSHQMMTTACGCSPGSAGCRSVSHWSFPSCHACFAAHGGSPRVPHWKCWGTAFRPTPAQHWTARSLVPCLPGDPKAKNTK